MSCALAAMKMVLDAVTGKETPEETLRLEAAGILREGKAQLAAQRQKRLDDVARDRNLNPGLPADVFDHRMRSRYPEPKMDAALDGYDPGHGTSIFALPGMFEKRHVKATIHTDMDIAKLQKATARGRPAILRIEGPTRQGHFVVVDAVTEKNGQKVLHVRDPNPPHTGRRYEIPAGSAGSDFYGNGTGWRMDQTALTVERKKQ